MPDQPGDETARKRWMVIVCARFAGVALVIVGLLIVQRVVEAPPELGYVLALAGLLGFFVVPIRLARRWRSPVE